MPAQQTKQIILDGLKELTLKQVETNILLGSGARNVLLVGGSRSGKTFLLVRAIVIRALSAPGSRHAILRQRTLHVRQSIWLDTLPKVLKTCFPWASWIPHVQDGYITFANGSEIWIGGLDDKERVEKILGKEFATLFFNECSQIGFAEVTTALTRLAQKVQKIDQEGKPAGFLKNRAFFDLNPTGTGHWSYRLFIEKRKPESPSEHVADPENYCHSYLNPTDNAQNIDVEYIQSLQGLPEKQRRRFFEGRYVAQLDGALWTLELIEKSRVAVEDLLGANSILGRLQRIVVSIDPSGASGSNDLKADAIGLGVVGIDRTGHAYLLEDATGLYSPEQWGQLAVSLFDKWGADRVIGERNFGGDMVRAIVHNVRRTIPYKEVTASRGKAVRAEPIAGLYEQERIHHVGRFPDLEDELTNFTTAGYVGSGSPNRADMLVWACTELFEGQMTAGVFRHLMKPDVFYNDASRKIGLMTRHGHAEHWISARCGTATPQIYADIYDDGDIVWVEREYYFDPSRQGTMRTNAQFAEDMVKGNELMLWDGLGDDLRAWPGVLVDPKMENFRAELSKRSMFVIDAEDNLDEGIKRLMTMLSTKKLRIHERCVNLIRDLETYAWDPAKAEAGKDQPEKTTGGGCECLAAFAATKIGDWRLETAA